MKNPEKIKLYRDKWYRNNPYKRLKSFQNSVDNISKFFKLSREKYRWALQAWTESVQKKDNYICQICENKSSQSHHILQKSFYPELSLNINNGVALCDNCHYETHGWRLK